MATHSDPAVPQAVPPFPPKQAAQGRLVEYEQFIDDQLRRTRSHVRSVDLTGSVMLLVAGSVTYFFVVALIDHWVIPRGLGFIGRLLALAGFVVAAIYYLAADMLPLLLKRINPVYAAHTIERSRPGMKNGLVNFLLFRAQPGALSPVVYQAIEEQAATNLAKGRAETAVDRSKLIHIGYALIAIVLVCALYALFSPKDLFQTVERVVLPWAEISAPTRTAIVEIEPGDARVFRGQQLTVAARVSGLTGEGQVLLYYSTDDGQLVDRAVEMNLPPDGYKYSCLLPAGESSLQQSLTYRIAAGDATTRTYHVEVVAAPTIVVERVNYKYPTYTGLLAQRVEHQGDIKAIEGTEITIEALANQDMQSAGIDFDCDGKVDVRMKAEQQAARGTFTLELKEDRQTPRHTSYQLLFKNEQGQQNPQPVRHQIEITRDLSPEIQFVGPKSDELDLPLNGVVDLELVTHDPDFALRTIKLVATLAGRNILEKPLLDEVWRGQCDRKFRFEPRRLGLKAGDVVEYLAWAEDNKDPLPNRVATPPRRIRIASAVKPENNSDRVAQKGEPGIAKPEPAGQRGDKDDGPGDGHDPEAEEKADQAATAPPTRPEDRKPAEGEHGAKSDPVANNADRTARAEPAGRQARRGGFINGRFVSRQEGQHVRRQRAVRSKRRQRRFRRRQRDRKDPRAAARASPKKIGPRPRCRKAAGLATKTRRPATGWRQATPRRSTAPGDKQQSDDKSDQKAGGDSPDKKSQQPGKSDKQQGSDRQKPGDKQKSGDQQQPGDKQQSHEGQGDQPPSEAAKSDSRERSGEQPGQEPQGKDDKQAKRPPNKKNDPSDRSQGKSEQKGAGAGDNGQGNDQGGGQDGEKGQPGQQGKSGQSSSQGAGKGENPGEAGENQAGQKSQGGKKGAGDKSRSGGASPDDKGDSGDSSKGDRADGDDSAKAGEGSKSGQGSKPGKQSPGKESDGEQGKPGDDEKAQGQPDKPGKSGDKPAGQVGPGRRGAGEQASDGSGKRPAEGTKPSAKNSGKGRKQPADRDGQGRESQGDEASDGAEKQTEHQAGQGDKAKGDAKNSRGKPPGDQQGDEAKGGEPEKEKGSAGAGQKGSDPKGSRSSAKQNQGRDKSQSSSPGDKDEKPGDDAQSPSNSEKESDSQGQNAGDESGGGKKGGGQKANKPGTGGPGENTPSDEGAGQADESGAGETSDRAGRDQQAKQKSGSSGSKPGEGSKTDSSAGDQSGTGKPQPKGGHGSQSSNNSSDEPADSSGAQSSGAPGAGKPPQSTRPNKPSDTRGDEQADAANLDYARKATDLAVNHLKDELRKDRPDPELLNRLGWTKKDLQNFVERWEQMRKQSQSPGAEGTAARRDLEESLRSLGLRPQATSMRGKATRDDQMQGVKESRRTTPPLEYLDQSKAYSQGTARGGK